MKTETETYLACLDNTYKFEDDSQVKAVVTCEDGRTAVLTDKTIFYPQGGGQPADTGVIQSETAKFQVNDVRMVNGQVYHYGTFSTGSFALRDQVKLMISSERRILNARLHSAGHVIDIAVQNLGLRWQPSKGYHFPDGPYVEYVGAIESAEDKEKFPKEIEAKAQSFISENLPVKAVVSESNEAKQLCGGELPEYVDKSRPVRVVSIGNNSGCPCGGTHVKELKDLGALEITKIKTKGDRIKVSYVLK